MHIRRHSKSLLTQQYKNMTSEDSSASSPQCQWFIWLMPTLAIFGLLGIGIVCVLLYWRWKKSKCSNETGTESSSSPLCFLNSFLPTNYRVWIVGNMICDLGIGLVIGVLLIPEYWSPYKSLTVHGLARYFGIVGTRYAIAFAVFFAALKLRLQFYSLLLHYLRLCWPKAFLCKILGHCIGQAALLALALVDSANCAHFLTPFLVGSPMTIHKDVGPPSEAQQNASAEVISHGLTHLVFNLPDDEHIGVLVIIQIYAFAAFLVLVIPFYLRIGWFHWRRPQQVKGWFPDTTQDYDGVERQIQREKQSIIVHGIQTLHFLLTFAFPLMLHSVIILFHSFHYENSTFPSKGTTQFVILLMELGAFASPLLTLAMLGRMNHPSRMMQKKNSEKIAPLSIVRMTG